MGKRHCGDAAIWRGGIQFGITDRNFDFIDWGERGEYGGETGENRAKIGAFAGACQPAGALSALFSGREAVGVRFVMLLSVFRREATIPARLSTTREL